MLGLVEMTEKTTWHYESHSADVLNTFGAACALGLAEYGAAVEAEAKMIVPVLSGNLQENISHESDEYSATVYANTPYATHVHEGTQFQKPRPFLTDAAKKQLSELPNRIRSIFNG